MEEEERLFVFDGYEGNMNYWSDKKKEKESRRLSSEEIRLRAKALFITTLLLLDLTFMLLLLTYGISYWGGV